MLHCRYNTPNDRSLKMNETWMQVIALFLANATLIFWMRSESRADWRLMDSKHESFRAEMGILLRSIQEEIKDFHARLCTIEERNKK